MVESLVGMAQTQQMTVQGQPWHCSVFGTGESLVLI